MAETPESNKTVTWIVLIVIVIAAVGGYMYYQEQNTESVSLNVGGKEISATVEE